MAWPTVVSAYESLREAHSRFLWAPEQEGLKIKLSRAIVDNFLIHRKEAFEQLSSAEQMKQKNRIIAYMQAYIEEKISAGEQIDLKLIKEPIEVATWISTYTHAQAERAKEILGADSFNQPLISTQNTAKVVNFTDYTKEVDAKQQRIEELEQQLHITQVSWAVFAPQGRRLNLGVVDIKYPWKWDRSIKHYRKLQPLYAQYLQSKSGLDKKWRVEALLKIIEHCMGFFPNTRNLMYRFQKGNFQHILTMSKWRRDTLAELIKADESSGKLGRFKYNRLLARKWLFNIYNEVLWELEQLIIKDERKKQSFKMAA